MKTFLIKQVFVPEMKKDDTSAHFLPKKSESRSTVTQAVTLPPWPDF